MENTIKYDKEEKEYIRDPITGKKKSLLSLLNKKKVSRIEMDELFIQH